MVLAHKETNTIRICRDSDVISGQHNVLVIFPGLTSVTSGHSMCLLSDLLMVCGKNCEKNSENSEISVGSDS